MRIAAGLICFLSAFCVIAFGAQAPFTFDAMMRIARIDEPSLSPDGRMVAFQVQTVDMAANTKPVQIYVVPMDESAPPRQITQQGNNTRPRWSPDSKRIFFVSDRSNSSQVWSMNPDGTDARQVTNLPTEADGEIV